MNLGFLKCISELSDFVLRFNVSRWIEVLQGLAMFSFNVVLAQPMRGAGAQQYLWCIDCSAHKYHVYLQMFLPLKGLLSVSIAVVSDDVLCLLQFLSHQICEY